MEEFWNWWQHIPSHIDPVIFQIGSFKVQYYGLMYIVAFAVTYYLVLYRRKIESQFHITAGQVLDLTTYMIIGLVVGARLGYVLFYNLPYYIDHPFEIVLPFNFTKGITFTGISGMSFHGGLLGVVASSWLYIRKAGLNFKELADLYVPVIPLGYTFGRLGNFINGELYGRTTTSPIGMFFPMAPGTQPRHPSQLYEAFFEGIFLFAVLWCLRKRPIPMGGMLALYLIGYGMVRFVIEFFREPDAHIGLVFISLSMGQLLCATMIVCGVLLYLFYGRQVKHQETAA